MPRAERRRPAAPGADPARGTGRLTRSAQWSGLRSGDPVDVSHSSLPRGSWAFVAHVANGANGQEWVEVVGGPSGARSIRAVRPEEVYPFGSLGARRRRPGTRGATRRAPGLPSLAEAPQLPLS